MNPWNVLSHQPTKQKSSFFGELVLTVITLIHENEDQLIKQNILYSYG